MNNIKSRVESSSKTLNSNSNSKSLSIKSVPSSSISTSLFDAPIKQRPRILTKFSCETLMFPCSSKKLNLLGRQIARIPLSAAIIQMKFSDKRAAKPILSTLQNAFGRIKMEASLENREKFVILAAMVGRGPFIKKIVPRARGRVGIQNKPHSFLRMEIGIPDPFKIAKKQLKVKNRFQRERENVYIKLDY